jgi:hypothetical protein
VLAGAHRMAGSMILVDAANVVGSRPTGWWRDRAGAAATFVGRLREAVAGGHLDAPVVVVLEGRARAGAPEGPAGGVEVVHAPGEGDDTLAGLAATAVEAGDEVVLVTADRGLRARAEAAGASVVGPSWLHDRIGRR